ncbi:MAG: type II toxin-antitoxin system VapC family toxin [Acidobacteria bacterium]|nr:type II toxin-antitoxin system VapC family toxin [Acidobacteriota bacterium]
MQTDLLLLDTHCWVWFQAGLEKKFSRSSYRQIERALRQDRCAVSIVSVWEIGLLVSKGRLNMHAPVDVWVREALSLPGLRLEPLSVQAALDSSALPGAFHGDPADRMLVATARHLHAALATADTAILDYGASGYVATMEC